MDNGEEDHKIIAIPNNNQESLCRILFLSL